VIIAIDGPSGAGKSTVAKRVGKKLGILYLDTGSMYRAFTLYAIERVVDLHNHKALEKALAECDISMNGHTVYLNGRDVSSEIRNTEVTDRVSYISSLPFVRKKMVELQRIMGKNRDVVAEGRDIGTVVFPETPYKFYLDAAIEERARRRYNDEKNVSSGLDIESIISRIERRDRFDSTRELSPLKKASDAHYIDSTGLTVDRVVDIIIKKVKEEERGVVSNGE